jgi:hypothetical protein
MLWVKQFTVRLIRVWLVVWRLQIEAAVSDRDFIYCLVSILCVVFTRLSLKALTSLLIKIPLHMSS